MRLSQPSHLHRILSHFALFAFPKYHFHPDQKNAKFFLFANNYVNFCHYLVNILPLFFSVCSHYYIFIYLFIYLFIVSLSLFYIIVIICQYLLKMEFLLIWCVFMVHFKPAGSIYRVMLKTSNFLVPILRKQLQILLYGKK